MAFKSDSITDVTENIRGITRGRRTAPGDTLQGLTPEGKKIVGKFTKNAGETRSDR